MSSWRVDIEAALRKKGGVAKLADIYAALPAHRRRASNWRSTVRRTLQQYAPRCRGAFVGRHPTFSRRGRGRWALMKESA